MTVAMTSKLAYRGIQVTLGDRQQQIYDALGELGVASNEQLADYLHLPINSVTGRVTELKKLGFVDVEGVTFNKSGHSAKQWSVRDPFEKKVFVSDCE